MFFWTQKWAKIGPFFDKKSDQKVVTFCEKKMRKKKTTFCKKSILKKSDLWKKRWRKKSEIFFGENKKNEQKNDIFG